jgi:hypothetical protein
MKACSGEKGQAPFERRDASLNHFALRLICPLFSQFNAHSQISIFASFSVRADSTSACEMFARQGPMKPRSVVPVVINSPSLAIQRRFVNWPGDA